MLSYFTGDGLYLSGSAEGFNNNHFDFYSKTKSLSSFYPPFSGAPVEYEALSNNVIRCKLPHDIPVGDYDLIFCNPAGYVKASSIKTFFKLTVLPLSAFNS